MKRQKYQAVWRVPSEQTNGFPKLMVADDVQTGSIRIKGGVSLWAIISTAINEGWEDAETNWDLGGYTAKDLAHFLYCLLEQRGEFGRIIMMLADVERPERQLRTVWWRKPSARKQVKAQLQRCIAVLEQIDEADR